MFFSRKSVPFMMVSGFLLLCCLFGAEYVSASADDSSGPVTRNLFLPFASDGTGIVLHGGWNHEVVDSGKPVSFTISTGEVVTWTGSHPESGLVFAQTYTTRFRKIRNEVVTATLESGDVLTKSVWVSPIASANAASSHMSCYAPSCELGDIVTGQSILHGTWFTLTSTPQWNWWLSEEPLDGLFQTHYDTKNQPVFSFVFDSSPTLLQMLVLNREWEGDSNYCTMDQYYARYYCSNAYWQLVSDHTSAVQSADVMTLNGRIVQSDWRQHILPNNE